MSKNEHRLELGFLENSHRFLKEAAAKAKLARTEEDQWMFAVSALIQSVELALKAALAEIHPVLIYENIDDPKRTVSIRTATNRLTNKKIGKLEFTERDQRRLQRAISIRNELTHSDFSINLAQVKANFHEVFAFLAEFNRKSFSINMDEIVDPAYLVEFLDDRKHHQEMLSRALTRIKDEGVASHLIRSCNFCAEETFVEDDGSFKCYLCHHHEDLVQCQNCGENFFKEELEDFSDAFQSDYSEGLYELINNYGYNYHTACSACVSEIKQNIYDLESQYFYEQMLEEEYQNKHTSQKNS
ncbi:hypothetical protein GFK91_10750 [Roseibium aggregatum]|uniref:hypothetical protein n=1 Tax=Roseibium aggregatum TaxID=187304 RepID=UPI001E488263|nr:hypothetical protein [Roseibium aggregatum]UES56044.1 hypothetical protein GFK91_10750 [Roseibium aggregatum]